MTELDGFLTRCEHPSVLATAAAALPTIPREHQRGTLYTLRGAIAGNRHTDLGTLLSLYDGDPATAGGLVKHPATPTDLLERIAADHPEVKVATAEHPNAAPELVTQTLVELHAVNLGSHQNLQRKVARRSAITGDMILRGRFHRPELRLIAERTDGLVSPSAKIIARLLLAGIDGARAKVVAAAVLGSAG